MNDDAANKTNEIAIEKAQEDIVISPCCGICALDDDDICIGCLRSGVEITHWGREDAEGKRAILSNVEARFRAQARK